MYAYVCTLCIYIYMCYRQPFTCKCHLIKNLIQYPRAAIGQRTGLGVTRLPQQKLFPLATQFWCATKGNNSL